jgi:flagella basal body P-ring formation protein FlgA
MSYRFALVLAFCAIAFSAFAQNADDLIDAVVPAHDIARGALIGNGDLASKSIAALRANDGIIRNIPDAAGKEAKRALRAGEFLRISDLKRPTLVAKGSTVTMVFDAPGITLTATGRALAEGGEGDSIPVLNPTSFRQVAAVVTAAGTVRVGPATGAQTNVVAAARP